MYPTPLPEPSIPGILDEDAFMDEENVIDEDALMDEDTFVDEDALMEDTDPTLHDALADEDIEDDFLTIDDDEDNAYDNNSNSDSGSQLPDGRRPKAAWSEETVQTEAMARLGICVNTAARIVVCLACGSAIEPVKLHEHLVRIHPPISTTAAFAQELADAYNLRQDVESRPGTIIRAIYGLELVAGYLACDKCGYACKSKKAMARHILRSADCNTCQERLVQTFRPSSKRLYFGVSLEPELAEESVEPSLDPVSYLKNKFAPIPFSNIPIKSAKNPRDANHFLNLEKWDLYVEGKTGAEIVQAVREREPELRAEVRICVERFAAKVVTALFAVGHEPRAAMGDYVG